MIPIVFWMITSIENARDEVKNVEDQPWKGFSLFLHVLLPVAGLALLWGQRGIFAKLLLQLDRSCVAVYCPSLSKREKLLKWASDRLPSTWSSQARTLSSGIPELWKDGSLLCTLINSVVPGACPNPHRHWRKPPLHAQALAYKYLGLVPVFTEDELSGELTINQERNFINYLHKLQEAINRWPTKDGEDRKFSSQYVARGMGLCTSEQHRKTVFYVYSNATTKKRSNVLMYIRGPYGTQGKATILPFHNLKTIPVVNVLKDQLEATKTLPFKNEEQKSFLKTISLDFTSLISTAEDKGESNDIPIQIEMEIDRAKITYIPNNSGIYEINLISDGELLRGSPYIVQVINNTSGKRDSFETESEHVDEKITFTKRKILSKVIDCVDEKICIDNDRVSQFQLRDSGSSTESESDDLTITAITKKNDEILKTEINCTLEDIIEEINAVQDERDNKYALQEIKTIAEKLKSEVPQIIDSNEVNVKVDSRHKVVKNCEEAKTELVNLLQNDYDEVDYNELEEKIDPKLDTNLIESAKYLKNIVNSTSSQEMLEKILPSKLLKQESEEDENNNSPKTGSIKRIKSKICLEISPKNSTRSNPSVDSLKTTSSICSDHIDPEVEKSSLNQLTLAEKRKILAKQDSVSVPDCDTTFSTTENEDSSNSAFRELSVMNVLSSLRQSRKNSLSDSLTSTVSLPNMASLDSNFEENTFRARKDYWERLSSRSSSSVSLANSETNVQSRKKSGATSTKKLFNNYFQNDDNKETKNETTKSVDSLLVIEASNVDDGRRNKSVDTSLEDCTLVPLEERKKQLLKNMGGEEPQPPKTQNTKLNFFKKDTKPKNEAKQSFFASISDRVQNFDKTNSMSKPKLAPEETKKSSSKQIIKSQFKRAINFFKNLEDNSRMKEKKREINRRYSLEIHQKKNNYNVRSGSLNLPNVSDRFFVNNLYEDVFGGKNGSFKGAPNKNGVADSLASLSRDSDTGKMQEKTKISYNLFVNKTKSKKRKSIKTLFDVHY
ncbi:uncharacterized protein LOC103315157 isoform X1 [Tribolium castaneum]|uniref:Uncharacterized protein n=1 Tax=Tribolium castaneum TaxID=7070 RepID=A0A139WMK9_TRICA|nr:PREDICTED: uncharacterized protein LOC103315157 isoform X1 [Tribolium castaneum]XP_008201332.1 PREDICTED: uncharacterized protein LOC103315157 isoform X1 [Tribolium castaneum]XP_015840627.1 PREDICTED: uncharacterized protein LOC103315157 isoform X1 [Tribolium castaneum]XP_015840628.1 PREDICTED: uncharacterized protein LOC103315157 isoform X1 [Tribolium castaneum]KYB29077.1 hypothetical protein TcasGA2_TC032052 [Tribolium castaneum]|eukprot:XP_008201330.1 PREDICTED: uncharacterized protein LOC103315157 isoform X1 [Tribolium castaneum]